MAVHRAHDAWEDLDRARFDSARADLVQLPTCLAEPLTATDAAAFHRVQALGAFLDKARTTSLVALQASRRADPQYVFPVDLVPEGHELRTMHDDVLRLPPPILTAVRVDEGTQLLVDGIGSHMVPRALPVLLQRVAADAAIQGAYLSPDDPLPDWALPLEAPRGPQPLWATIAAALLVGGGASLGVGLGTEASLVSGGVAFDDIDATANRANVLGRTGQGLLVAGGLATIAAVTWPRKPR